MWAIPHPRAAQVLARVHVDRPRALPRAAVDDAAGLRGALDRQSGEMDELRAKLDAARAEADRLKALASTTAAAAGGGAGVPSDADLLRTARQLQTPDAAFAEAPPAPSTAELLELLDSYEDANNRPAAFGDVRLPDGALVPGPTITSL